MLVNEIRNTHYPAASLANATKEEGSGVQQEMDRLDIDGPRRSPAADRNPKLAMRCSQSTRNSSARTAAIRRLRICRIFLALVCRVTEAFCPIQVMRPVLEAGVPRSFSARCLAIRLDSSISESRSLTHQSVHLAPAKILGDFFNRRSFGHVFTWGMSCHPHQRTGMTSGCRSECLHQQLSHQGGAWSPGF